MASNSLKIPPLRFECTGCGKCCTQRGEYAHVYVGDAEVESLAKLLGVSLARFRREHTKLDTLGWRQLRFRDGLCTFLDPQSQRCTVYAARPVQCRTFPFWPEIVGPKGWSDEVKEMCEGIGRGDVVPADTVAEALHEMRVADGSDD